MAIKLDRIRSELVFGSSVLIDSFVLCTCALITCYLRALVQFSDGLFQEFRSRVEFERRLETWGTVYLNPPPPPTPACPVSMEKLPAAYLNRSCVPGFLREKKQPPVVLYAGADKAPFEECLDVRLRSMWV